MLSILHSFCVCIFWEATCLRITSETICRYVVAKGLHEDVILHYNLMNIYKQYIYWMINVNNLDWKFINSKYNIIVNTPTLTVDFVKLY